VFIDLTWLNDTLEGNYFHGVVFFRIQMDCSTPAEFANYSATQTRRDICFHCGKEFVEKSRIAQCARVV
jgi:hypothetical protein